MMLRIVRDYRGLVGNESAFPGIKVEEALT